MHQTSSLVPRPSASSALLTFELARNLGCMRVQRSFICMCCHSFLPSCGYATLHDVTKKTKEDRMESFFLSETCKYLYLVGSGHSNGLPLTCCTASIPLHSPVLYTYIPIHTYTNTHIPIHSYTHTHTLIHTYPYTHTHIPMHKHSYLTQRMWSIATPPTSCSRRRVT